MFKRMIPLFLCLALYLGAVPDANATANNRRNHITDRSAVDGSHYTPSPALAEELNTVFDGNANIYSDRECTDLVSTELGSSPVKNNGVRKYVGSEGHMVATGTSCFIYANGVYYTLFGESTGEGEAGINSEKLNITGSGKASYENFKAWGVRQGVGALIRASGHSMILLDYDEYAITYLDGNSDGRGLVSINHEPWDKFFYSYVSYIIQPKDHHYATLYASGMCGEDLIWAVDDAGTLTITGTGNIQFPAWNSYCDRIKRIVIDNGVTGIGSGMFYNCVNLQEIVFNGKPPVLSDSTFLGVTATALYPAAKGGWSEENMQHYGGNLTWEPYGMTPLQITGQPAFSRSGTTVTTTITAEGDGLTYAWYTKETDQAVYVKTTVTGTAYTMKATDAAAKRQVMCVVTDQYGNTVKSESAMLHTVTGATLGIKTLSLT